MPRQSVRLASSVSGVTEFLAKLKRRFLRSPGGRAFAVTCIVIGTGVLTSVFANAITTPAGIDWRECYKQGALYLLLAWLIVVFVYQRSVYLHDISVERFADKAYCIAYMRSECLPEAAERAKKLIRGGELDTFSRAMDEVKKALE